MLLYFNLQGQGLGFRLMKVAEELGPTSQVEVVSCFSDLIAHYGRRGYVEVRRDPMEDFIPRKCLTLAGRMLRPQMVVMQKGRAMAQPPALGPERGGTNSHPPTHRRGSLMQSLMVSHPPQQSLRNGRRRVSIFLA